jgi:hypothetical protein
MTNCLCHFATSVVVLVPWGLIPSPSSVLATVSHSLVLVCLCFVVWHRAGRLFRAWEAARGDGYDSY